MESWHYIVFGVIGAVTYLACIAATKIAHTTAGQIALPRRLFHWQVFWLFLIAATVETAFLWLYASYPVEMIIFLYVAGVAVALLLILTWPYLAATVRKPRPVRPGLVAGAATLGSFSLAFMLVATFLVTYSVTSLMGQARHTKAMDEYYAKTAENTVLHQYDLPQPDPITKIYGEGGNSSFDTIEQYPNAAAKGPSDWHGRYPPEHVYWLECETPPAELNRWFISELQAEGYTVYQERAKQPGTAQELYLAGYRDGIFAQYKTREVRDRKHPQGGASSISLMVWSKYGEDINSLAQTALMQMP